jgi:pimeloyl-ACP methyl ester carboxylesterase
MNKFNHITGKYFAIDEANIYYEETGVIDQPVLLLLHGGLGSIEDFNPIIPRIEKDFHIIGVDSRGQGKSTLGIKKLSYEVVQDDIEQLLKSIRVQELSIIGFSDGGIVAYRLATYSNLKINKLVTISSRWHKNNVTETREFLSVTPKSWRNKFPETVATYEKLNPEADFEKLCTAVVDMWLNEDSYPNENVKNISANTLIVRGDKDHLIKRSFAFEVAQLIKDSNLANIAFAGHALQMDQPELLTLTINKFLNQ